jgi:methyl-accepting chemotaxis protein
MLKLLRSVALAEVEREPETAIVPPALEVLQAPEVPQEQPGQTELLQRWMSLASMQQRVIESLVSEITGTSAFVETEAEALSGRFQRLAFSAEQQTARVESLTNLAKGIEVEGEQVPIERIAGLLEGTLSDVVAKILMLSKDSMAMVYALDGLSKNVVQVDKCMVQLNRINKTTNMLALNARIEAERAGTAGMAFRVVAGEVQELSKATESLSREMQAEIKTVTTGIVEGQATLQRVATIDMSDNIMAKDRLEVLMSALINRSDNLSSIVADAVREAAQISSDVDGMVTGIQFQDRTRQRLEHVVDTLQVLGQALEEIKGRTMAVVPELSGEPGSDVEWVKGLLDNIKMSELRARFVAQVLDGKQLSESQDASAADAPAESGSVELF